MKKFLPYILILVVMFGFFGTTNKVNAQVVNGKCVSTSTYGDGTPAFSMENISLAACQSQLRIDNTGGIWTPNNPPGGDPVQIASPTTQTETQQPKKEKSDFEKMLGKTGCDSLLSFDMGACVLKFLYYGIQMPVAGILWIAAKFFDYLIFFTLSTTLFKQPFVGGAWGVVRDLSNIFFILILLFVAFETILGLAHDAQKTITKVIVVAMLINFSMFFTGVVIDTSNVLALVFYNKVDIKYKDKDGNIKDRPDTPVGNAKDISGSMAEKFNLTNLVTGDMFKQAGDTVNKVPGSGQTIGSEGVPTSLMITIVLIAIVIMAVAAYAFIVAGLSFLGRMIELFVLIIFSPFAFMSSTLPKLAGTEYLGWEPWSKRLITVSFMAPIFMFFLYFIFLLMNGPLLEQAKNVSGDSFISKILGMILPTLFIVSLLLKATEFAKKGSGKFGEMTMTGAKLLGGLALGAATGGAALLATNTIGARAQRTANDDNLKAGASGNIDDKTRAHFAKMGITSDEKIKAFSQKKLATANKYANKSFDIRDTGIGKFAAKKSGMDFNQGTSVLGVGADKLKGGRVKQTERKVEELEKIKKTYELSGSAADKQNDRNKEYNDDLAQTEKNFGRTFSDKEKEEFKKDYEAGKDLSTKYGIGKKIEAGSIKTSKEINNDRKKAYLVSLEDAATKEAGKNAAKTFWDEFKSEEKKMYTTAGGIAQTVALGAATGGIGLVAGPLALSLARAIKTTVAKKVMGDVRSTNAEVIASLRKGPDEYKELIKKMKKDLEGGGHGASAPTPAHPKTPAPVSPTPSAGPAHAGGHHTP